MYYVESESLLHDGVSGESVIRAVDEFLGTHSRVALFEAAMVASATNQSVLQVQAALSAYVTQRVVIERDYYRCPDAACQTLNPVERVDEARADGDEDPCDGPCNATNMAALDEPQRARAYQVIKPATPPSTP